MKKIKNDRIMEEAIASGSGVSNTISVSKKYLTAPKIDIKQFCPCIPDEQLKMNFGKLEYKNFWKWMRGQTCPIGGVYMCDLESYIRQRNRGIKAKNVYNGD